MPQSAADHLKRAAIYTRVSTIYQIDKDSLVMQKNDLVNFAELILGITSYEIFEDAGFSGKNTDRPAYQRMMGKIMAGEFTHLLVWKIDRISRNLLDFAAMYQELNRLGVVFVSRNEQFDTSTAMGEAMLKIILVFAELERGMAAERVTSTMLHRANSGLWNGGIVPLGYTFDKETGAFSISPDEAALVKLIFAKYLEHPSLAYVVSFLNSQSYTTRSGNGFSKTTVRQIIRNPWYTGAYHYNSNPGPRNKQDKIITPGHHPALIEPDTFQTVQSLLSRNSSHLPVSHGRPTCSFIFDGLCHCANCGSILVHHVIHRTKGPPLTYYSCLRAMNRRSCPAKQIQEKVIGEFVLNLALNILNAQHAPSAFPTTAALQARILLGSTFSDISSINPLDLIALQNAMGATSKDVPPVFFTRLDPDSITQPPPPDVSTLEQSLAKHQKALDRLNHIFLYDDAAMTDAEFSEKRAEILANINALNDQIEALSSPADASIDDQSFVAMASAFILEHKLADRNYIYFPNLAKDQDHAVLHSFFSAIYQDIIIGNKRVEAVVFRNGLSLHFNYRPVTES